jgi:hypothetical protein
VSACECIVGSADSTAVPKAQKMQNLIHACEMQQANFARFQTGCDSQLRSSQRLIDESRNLIAETKNLISRLQEFS